MKEEDFLIIERLFEILLKDAKKSDFERVRRLVASTEQLYEREIIKRKALDKAKKAEECNTLIEHGAVHLGSKICVLYNHMLVECFVDTVPTTSAKFLKIRFISSEGAGSPNPTKYVSKEYFHSLVNN